MNYLDELLKRLSDYAQTEWCDRDREEAKRCLLDYTGTALAGAYSLKEKHKLYQKAVEKNAGRNTVILAGRQQADCYTAVLLNALSAHKLELDDGHRYGMLHPGVPVISALLAVWETENLSAEDFLRAIAVGYEAMIRLAVMVQPEHKKKGFHASATCGTFGAAMAVSYARAYDSQQIRCAASAALTSASGLLAMIDDDSELKPYNCAQAAVNGLMAANTALCGYWPPSDALGGKRGFLNAVNGGVNEDKFEKALKMTDCIGTIYRKMYASCRHTHPAVEGALMIRKRCLEKVPEIQKIDIETYELAVYGHDQTEISSISSAKMSTPYSVAAALKYGLSGLDAFSEELLADASLMRLVKKITMKENDELSALVPIKRAAEVKVFCKDGNVLKERVDYPKGEPENPLTEEELRGKFSYLAAFAGKTKDEILKLIKSVDDLDVYRDLYLDLIK